MSESKYLARMDKRGEDRKKRFSKIVVDLKPKWDEIFDFVYDCIYDGAIIFKIFDKAARIYASPLKTDLDKFEEKGKEYDLDQDNLIQMLLLIIHEGHRISSEFEHKLGDVEKEQREGITDEQISDFQNALKNHKLFRLIVAYEERMLSSIEELRLRRITISKYDFDIDFIQLYLNVTNRNQKETEIHLEMTVDEIKGFIKDLENIIKEKD